MPCGGIYPCAPMEGERCFYCGKRDCDHYVEEWDGGLHGTCIDDFLKTREGAIVINHKHKVVRKTGDTYEVLEDGQWRTMTTTTD